MSDNAKLNELALANVEALAQSEGGSGDCDAYCQSESGYTCIILWPGAEGITCPSHRRK